MRTTRYSVSRRKACLPCSNAKEKCDRVATGCARCAKRGLSCVYTGATVRENADRSGSGSGSAGPTNNTAAGNHSRDGLAPNRSPRVGDRVIQPAPSPRHDNNEPVAVGSSVSPVRSSRSFDTMHLDSELRNGPDVLDFSSGLKLTSLITVEDISNRWLKAYIPLPEQLVKDYPPTIQAFIYRMIRSHVTVAIRGRGYPPFIHPLQITAQSITPPLSTCASLIRVCDDLLPGSENTAAEVLQREMTNLHARYPEYDTLTTLGAFQAYLIYAMALFFKFLPISGSFLREAVMKLQEIACASAKKGLVCEAEQQGHRPPWESWIIAEANRRTLYTMYLFDNVLSSHDGLPTFIGTELSGLPAPSSRTLWRAQARNEWEMAYNTHLAGWSSSGLLRVDELWPMPASFDDTDVEMRRERVDHWLEGVDEFGTMIFTVTSCTHGG